MTAAAPVAPPPARPPTPRRPPPAQHELATRRLADSVALARRVVDHAETALAQGGGGGPSLLPSIDLPGASSDPEDQANLQVAGPLYLAADVEQAGLVHAVETLAGLFASGGLPGDAGAAGGMLERFWRERTQRFAQPERQALYARLFDESTGPTLAVHGAVNEEFGTLMIDLCEAIHRLRDGTLGSSQGPVRVCAEALSENLLPRVGGIASFAARELLGAVHQAIAILEIPALQRSLGAHSLWQAVHAVMESEAPRSAPESAVEHVNRGSSGLAVLTWLSSALPGLGAATGDLVTAGSPVLDAATAWLEASLALAEAHTPPQRSG